MMKFKTATAKYLSSKQFGSLANSSQKGYENKLNSFCRDTVHGRTLGNISINKINTIVCTELYDTWELETSTSNANHCSRIFSVLMNYLVAMDFIPKNPMAKVRKRTSEPRSVVWTHDQVMSFLDMAFTRGNWTSIGMIVMMAYEWAQRPIDIRSLKWENVDLDKQVVKIKQTKRGARVELPVPDNLNAMLKQQEDTWGFQEWVVPHHRPQDNAYRPLTVMQMTHQLRQVKDAVGLPDELQVGDLRKTAIIEMILGGAEALAIQSATGHKNVASLNPYNKFTLETAKSAIDKRVRL